MGQRADIGGREKQPEELRGEIEHTRAELTETVSALKEKLSSEHLKKEMKDRVRNATVGKARETVSRAMDRLGVRRGPQETGKDTIGRVTEMAALSSEKIRHTASSYTGTLRGNVVSRTIIENPVPSILAGFGIGWLILKGRRGNGRDRFEETSWEGEPESRSWSGELVEQAKTRAGEAYEGAREKAENLTGKVREKAENLTGQIREKTSQYRETVRSRTPDYSRYRSILEERPLAVLAAAFVLGMAVGFSVPETEREDEWMGQAKETAKEKIVTKAKEVAEEAVGKAERVVKEAQRSATEKAREEGIPL